MAIRSILLDLDGVLRVWPPGETERAEQAAGLPAGTIRRVAFDPELLHPAIEGRISDAVWRRRIVERIAAEVALAAAERAIELWSAPSGEVNQETLELIRACRRRVPVILVSNATDRLERDLARLGLLAELDGVINSSAVGHAKPKPEIFAAALALAGTEPGATLYVDDTEPLVVAARELGLHAHHYRGTADLRALLLRHGLITS